jgi:tripartite-type tricarboxylate transporter receptor subunit TctC
MRLARIAALAAALACAGFVHAQDRWPSKPIRYIVPFAAGGTTDVLGRMVTPKLGEALGTTFVVENRPGAGGNVGSEALARSAPDGYTIGGGTVSSHAINASLYPKMPYDNLKDFVPVALLVTVPNVLVVNPAIPATSVAELVGYGKANPGKLTCASAGNGTSQHMSCELFKTLTGLDITHVPYKGSAPGIASVVSGETTMMFDNATIAVPQMKGGRVRAIGVTTARRSPSLPDVPALAEQGLTGYDVSSWQAVFAPAGTPKSIVDRLNAEIRKILASPEIREKLLAVASDPADMTPEQFAEFVRAETEKWAKVVKASGARVD